MIFIQTKPVSQPEATAQSLLRDIEEQDWDHS
jgi:hypothetical protein